MTIGYYNVSVDCNGDLVEWEDTVRMRLDNVRTLIKANDFKSADQVLNTLYEDYTCDRVILTEDEEDRMFCYLDTISKHFYPNLV